MNKVERYDWTKPGHSKGALMQIPVGELQIDLRYQRGEVAPRTTLKKASEWDWVKCGVLLVGRRENTYYVIDGGQRTRAAKHREDIRTLPCMVYDTGSWQDEALLFYSVNVDRNPVAAYAKWAARLAAGTEPEVSISKAVERHGYHVTEDGKNVNGLSCPAALVRVWLTQQSQFDAILRNVKSICAASAPTLPMIKGVAYLMGRGVCVDDHANMLAQKGGPAYVMPWIKATAIECNLQGLTDKACGLGMLAAINRHLRSRKIKL